MVSIAHVAGWFSRLAGRDGETLDLPRLQALAYIAQGLAVALYYEPLFASRIEAGEDGPLICELSAPDCQVADLDPPSPHGVESVIKYVYERFGALPSKELARAARGGAAWPNALAHGIGTMLSYDDMREDFRSLVSELASESDGTLADEPPQPISHEQAMQIIQREHPDLARKTAIGRAQLDAGLAVPHPPVRW